MFAQLIPELYVIICNQSATYGSFIFQNRFAIILAFTQSRGGSKRK